MKILHIISGDTVWYEESRAENILLPGLGAPGHGSTGLRSLYNVISSVLSSLRNMEETRDNKHVYAIQKRGTTQRPPGLGHRPEPYFLPAIYP